MKAALTLIWFRIQEPGAIPEEYIIYSNGPTSETEMRTLAPDFQDRAGIDGLTCGSVSVPQFLFNNWGILIRLRCVLPRFYRSISCTCGAEVDLIYTCI